MPAFNKVFIIGHLTRDPALKFLPNQTAVCEFGIACNRKFRTADGEDKEEVTFVDATCFGKRGEVINEYFSKGKPIFVEARLKYDSWDDKNGGGKRSKLSLIVEDFQFVGGNDDRRTDDDRRPQPRQQPARRPVAAGRNDGREAKRIADAVDQERQFDDESIPF